MNKQRDIAPTRSDGIIRLCAVLFVLQKYTRRFFPYLKRALDLRFTVYDKEKYSGVDLPDYDEGIGKIKAVIPAGIGMRI